MQQPVSSSAWSRTRSVLYLKTVLCDNECAGLDFVVHRNGAEVVPSGSGSLLDDLAEHFPRGHMLYTLKVTMSGCSPPSCGYQITAWQTALPANNSQP